ncbi:MAG: phosphotransferase family protein [Porticoccaceae bacterium]
MRDAKARDDVDAAVIDTATLTRWLADTLAPGSAIRLLSTAVPATGYSALTMLIDAEIVNGGAGAVHSLVLRLEKPGQHVFFDTDVARQGQMMRALGNFDMPVPRVLGIETDPAVLGGKFLVMERVEGVSLPQSPCYHVAGLLTELDDGGRCQLWNDAISTIARINRLDWNQGFGFLDRSRYGKPGLGQYLGWLSAWRDEAMAGAADPVIDRAMARLTAEQPFNHHVDVLWGDSNPGNYLFGRDGQVVAALDFEAAALGPGEIDLAWWFFMDEMLSFGHQRQSGLPSREQQIALYEAILGRRVEDLDYFELLAAVRIALVIARTANVLIEAGRLPPTNKTAHFNPAIQLLATRLDMPDIDIGSHFAEFSQVMNSR